MLGLSVGAGGAVCRNGRMDGQDHQKESVVVFVRFVCVCSIAVLRYWSVCWSFGCATRGVVFVHMNQLHAHVMGNGQCALGLHTQWPGSRTPTPRSKSLHKQAASPYVCNAFSIKCSINFNRIIRIAPDDATAGRCTLCIALDVDAVDVRMECIQWFG